MHGQFLREMPETVDKVKTWEWTRKGDLKFETEALIFAAQEQALRTNYVTGKFNINKSVAGMSLSTGCRQKSLLEKGIIELCPSIEVTEKITNYYLHSIRSTLDMFTKKLNIC